MDLAHIQAKFVMSKRINRRREQIFFMKSSLTVQMYRPRYRPIEDISKWGQDLKINMYEQKEKNENEKTA